MGEGEEWIPEHNTEIPGPVTEVSIPMEFVMSTHICLQTSSLEYDMGIMAFNHRCYRGRERLVLYPSEGFFVEVLILGYPNKLVV